MFFSRTDERGIIRNGNYVFRRVSHFEWDELSGAPHKIIRHPDMPSAVFHIMWKRIQNGEIVSNDTEVASDATPAPASGPVTAREAPRVVNGAMTYSSWEDVEATNVSAADKILKQMRQQ